jgi:arsenate reductase
MPQIRVYEKPTCTTCRELAALLTDRGIDFERVDYHVDPLSEDEIRALLAKAGAGPREVMRTNEPQYRGLSGDESDDELIALMARHPALLQRPIVEVDDRAVLARPPERVLELL